MEGSSVEQSYASWLRKHPSALSSFDRMISVVKGKQIVVFLDYDGTLSPIVNDPDRAFMSPEMRAAVRNVSNCFPTAIISGRSRKKVHGFVQLDTLFYSGSHGFDTKGPALNGENEFVIFQPAKHLLPEVKKMIAEITQRTQHIQGVTIEDNEFCVSVHYRNVRDEDFKKVEAQVKSMLAKHPNFKFKDGKKVLEIRPSMDWNKGHALNYLLGTLGFNDSSKVFPIYIGDDTTDEDAFKVIRERGQGYPIIVSTEARKTLALYSLQTTSEVQSFLTYLSGWGVENDVRR